MPSAVVVARQTPRGTSSEPLFQMVGIDAKHGLAAHHSCRPLHVNEARAHFLPAQPCMATRYGYLKQMIGDAVPRGSITQGGPTRDHRERNALRFETRHPAKTAKESGARQPPPLDSRDGPGRLQARS